MCGTFQDEMRRLLLTFLVPAIALSAIACADDSTAGPPGVTEDYVPDAPIAYDARYLDGSFEGNQGTGWDTCHTRTPGKLSHASSGGSEGSAYLTFESGACDGTCAPTNPSASHLYTWFIAAPSATAKMGLYFDVKNEGTGGAPTGVLRFYGTDLVCQQDSVLAEIELAKLKMSSGWTTRCATITGPGADTAIGISVSGGTHKIGVDAIRLGPPCHAGS
jgi:hypothetical protein